MEVMKTWLPFVIALSLAYAASENRPCRIIPLKARENIMAKTIFRGRLHRSHLL
jgi:hypothetical protein